MFSTDDTVGYSVSVRQQYYIKLFEHVRSVIQQYLYQIVS